MIITYEQIANVAVEHETFSFTTVDDIIETIKIDNMELKKLFTACGITMKKNNSFDTKKTSLYDLINRAMVERCNEPSTYSAFTDLFTCIIVAMSESK